MRRPRKIGRIMKGLKREPLLFLGGLSAILLVAVFLLPYNFNNAPSGDPSFSLETAASGVLNSVKRENDASYASPASNLWQSPEAVLVQGNALKGLSAPTALSFEVLGSLVSSSQSGSREVAEYTAQEGDTVQSVADSFSISLNTLLWANNLSKNSKLALGQQILILPVSGVLYEVKKGDTLSEVANKYKGDKNEIVAFNELSGESDIFVGDMLVIPGGFPPAKKVVAPAPTPNLVPMATGLFMCPIAAPCNLTQGLHWYNAVDITHGKCGESILAVAAGEVLRVKYGYNLGAGNTVEILHSNGVITTYGHVLTSLVNAGDKVSQGQAIALMGGQPGTPGAGISTGCHVHFGVKGAANPFAN